jgi:hypothetical protein
LIRYIEPIEEEEKKVSEFIDATVGGSIPPNFMPAVTKVSRYCTVDTVAILHSPIKLISCNL